MKKNFLNNFFIKKDERLLNSANLKKYLPELANAIDSFQMTSAEKEAFKRGAFSEDAKSIIEQGHADKVNPVSSWKKLIFNFFGMNDNWPLARNLLGGFMVHCPEYPTYFIPAFMQAKATGEAKELKKGEGPRGLITGGLEGIAVGALVSGEKLKLKEMGPYILLGAALQLFSSKVFPWLGEKLGQRLYQKNKINTMINAAIDTIAQPFTDDSEITPEIHFNSRLRNSELYRNQAYKSGGMKI